MQKRTDTQEFNIPKDDIECWDRYPKHRWVYDLSRLLDAQNIAWSPFATESLKDKVVNMRLSSDPGYIYINNPQGIAITSEVYITKGEVKHMRHFDTNTSTELQDSIGNIELRISAFVSMHFQKFTGVITVDSIGNYIMTIRLRPHSDEYNTDILKLIKRIYKKTDITLNVTPAPDFVLTS